MSSQAIILVLGEASRLLEQKGWTRFAIARNQGGEPIAVNSGTASSYSLSGALVTAWRNVDPANEDFYFLYFEEKLAEILRKRSGYELTFTQWNDRVAASREEVVNLIRALILLLTDEDAQAPSRRASFGQELRSA